MKLRGFRIELGEIESRLSAIAGIQEVAALAREDANGDKRLVAYYRSSVELKAEWLRSQLASELPEYMVPMAYMRLEALPLTPNGKLDRKSLPLPTDPEAGADGIFVATRTPTEEAIAAIWQKVLCVQRVSALDDFFELGGHSLLAMQVIACVAEELDVELPVRMIFEAKTVARLAEAADALSVASNFRRPKSDSHRYPG